MPPIPIMSTETLASCAETRQNGAAKISAVNETPFIMRQIRAPLTQSPKIRCLVGPPIGQYHRPCELEQCRPNRCPGTAAALGSVNVLSLQHHDESGRSVTADRGWKRRFEDPIPLPSGRCLVTLEDAGNYITKLPKAEHQARKWRVAMEALISGACRSTNQTRDLSRSRRGGI
jgi:hypothetical protein